MGVPGFFAWLLRKDKKKILYEYLENKIDYLFLDTNGLIHPQCFKTLDENSNFKNLEELERKMIKSILDYIDFIVEYAKPQKMVYIAVDGVAPMAKIKHQRARRYKSVVDSERINSIKQKHNIKVNNHWSNASITPGTSFMNKITKAIEDHISKINSKKVIFSSALIPGEGEHKIMSFIRSQQFEPNDTFAVYGLDADLIFLSLATMKKNIFLLREYREIDKQKSGLPFVWVSIDNLKQLVVKIFNEKDIAHDYTIHDFIFICYLLGNDFIPNLQTVNIYEKGIDKILKIYCKAYKGESLIKLEKKLEINFKFLEEIFFLLTLQENNTLKEQWFKSLEQRHSPGGSAYEVEMWNFENLNFSIDDPVKLGSDSHTLWQKRYYQHYFANANNIPSICQHYFEGLYWIALYYFIDCKSWKWHYKYDQAPLVSTLYLFLKNDKLRPFTLKKDKPISPLEQLLIVIPQKLSYLLPNEFVDLLMQFAPTSFTIDYVRKLKYWQGMPDLPAIDYKKLHSVVLNKLKKPMSSQTQQLIKSFTEDAVLVESNN